MTTVPQAVAWTLIHFCWQATAIAAAYGLIAAAIARRSSQARYVVALSSLLLMVALAAGTFAWEIHSTSTAPVLKYTPEFAAAPTSDFPHTMPSIQVAPKPSLEHINVGNLLPWIDALWLAGVLVLSIRSFGGWWYLRRLRLSAITHAPDAVRASFDRICAALGLHRLVALRISTAIDSPMTLGTLRAIVLLPLSAITSLGPEELEVVLAHEIAHVRRADFFWNILQTIAETLFFFHPAVWWISARIRHERELCCDDLALKICPNPVTYASALYRLEEHRSRHLRLAMALDGHASRHTLFMRIARILGEPMTRIPSRSLRPFSLVAACAGLIALLVPVPHVLAGLTPAQHPTALVSTPIPVPVVESIPQAAANAAKPSPNPIHAAAIDQGANPQSSNRNITAQLTTSMTKTVVGPEAALAATSGLQSQPAPDASGQPHSDYIDRMKAAGYDVDLDKLIAMKVQNVTPEYAQAMAQAGFGKLSADDLIACKIQGVTPESIAEMKKQGLEINSVHDAISFRIFQVTPEFVAGMKAAGFDGLTSQQLLSMRVQGVTPEYARTLKQKFPKVTAEDLVKARIFRIDDEFIAQAQRHGFNNLPFDKLVQLRISGLLDDESVKQ